MAYTLAIDQSTSATKALLFSEQLHPVASAAVAHSQLYPQPGWVEHNPEELLRNAYAAAAQALAQAGQAADGVGAVEVASVAITNQRETVVVWDRRTGSPVYNAVVWQCRRGADSCNRLIAQGHEDAVRRKTGLLINPYFSASGAQWILDNVAGARAAAAQGHLLLGTVDAWLVWNFTGGQVHATDYTNASRTLLFDISALAWDNELLDLFTIPRSMMPRALPCDTVFGHTTLGGLLPRPVPIAGVIGDSHAALAGQQCFATGMGKATYGTGSSLMVNIGQQPVAPPKGLVTSVGFAAQGEVHYALEGNIHCTGDTIRWLVENLGLLASPAESELLAASLPDNGGVYLVPAFAGLGAPWWDSEARALLCGMTRGTGKAHVARAALEAIACQIKDLADLVTHNAGVPLLALRVDGGPVKNRFLMQLQADVLGIPLHRSEVAEASALGATLMGGLALGRFGSLNELAALRYSSDCITPRMPAAQAKQLYEGWKQAVRKAMSKAEPPQMA